MPILPVCLYWDGIVMTRQVKYHTTYSMHEKRINCFLLLVRKKACFHLRVENLMQINSSFDWL
jgi:hypothetical protein